MSNVDDKFTPEQHALLKDAFDGIDEDDSGFIEKKELITLYKEIAAQMGDEFDLEKAEQDFNNCDDNNDGVIDLEEFKKHLSHFVIN